MLDRNKQLRNTVENLLNLAMKKPGVTAAEVTGSVNSGLYANVRLGVVDSIEFNRDKSISITIYKDKCKGYVSATDLSDAALAAALTAACNIADYTEADQYSGLADKQFLATNVPDLHLNHPHNVTAEQAIEYAKECEAAALRHDKAITNSEGASFSTNEQYFVYANSNGFIGGYPSTRYSASCTVIGEQQDLKQRDYDFTTATDINDLQDMGSVGVNAARKTVARLGAKKLSTRKTPVLFAPRVAASLWGHLLHAISGGNLYRKSSFLVDRLNTKILPEFVNIYERPHMLKALGSAPFDLEGVATKNKDIVNTGILSTYLLGSYSARRLGMQTTGNSGGVHNCVVQAGELDFAGMLRELGTGLLVTELMGHGTNLVTGDYSHGAVGFWVENGEIAYPVEEITVASNLQDMFNRVVKIGNDVDKRGNILTGSVLIESMMVAGSNISIS